MRARLHNIEILRGWKQHISEDWIEILKTLNETYSEGSCNSVCLSSVATRIDRMFRRCGLQVSDTNKGIHLDVVDTQTG